MASRRPRGLDRHGVPAATAPREGQPDTFFVGPVPSSPPAPLDVRDPRNRTLFRLDDWQMDVDNLKTGAPVEQPTVSASMATALLAYSGITVKMLVDQRLDAHLHTMFMVQYQASGVAQPHDHPFEESYYMLEGEVEVVADDERYTLRPGDVFWTGVGCIHAFYNTRGKRVRWLETSAPGLPTATRTASTATGTTSRSGLELEVETATDRAPDRRLRRARPDGSADGRRVLDAGFPLTVWNRSGERTSRAVGARRPRRRGSSPSGRTSS